MAVKTEERKEDGLVGGTERGVGVGGGGGRIDRAERGSEWGERWTGRERGQTARQ